MRWYERLRRAAEIAYVRRRGRAAAQATLVAFVAEGRGARPRVAVSVSSEVGGAVVRNLIRRRIRGALDALPPAATPFRALFVVKPPAAAAPYGELAGDVASALGRLGTIRAPGTS